MLYDLLPRSEQAAVLKKILPIQPGDIEPSGILSASYYYRFYLARAMEHAGLADDYLGSLEPWRKLLKLHFSTWPEVPGNSRSDSHAWSAHPMYDLLTLVTGIEPGSPGLRTVRITPHLDTLTSLEATYPHPAGQIRVLYHVKHGVLTAHIELPGELRGVFLVNGHRWLLHSGENVVKAQSAKLPHTGGH